MKAATTRDWIGVVIRHEKPIATVVLGLLLCWLGLSQVVEIRAIGNGVDRRGDPYSEANAFRAAEHYARYGFLVDMGLPHILHGSQFPQEGWVRDQSAYPLHRGVYTRYPPLPDLICGVLEWTIGHQQRWIWRLVPIAVGLVALLFAFRLFRVDLGPLPAALLVGLAILPPLMPRFLHGLHFEGYADALGIGQVALISRLLFQDPPPSRRQKLALLALGFGQGWLSFEFFFVVALMAVPLSFAVAVSGGRATARRTALLALLPGLGFVAAHLLHLAQVAGFYGSLDQALGDLLSRGKFRMVGPATMPYGYAGLAAAAVVEYVKLVFTPANGHFGVWMAVVFAVALGLPLVSRGVRTRPGARPLARTEGNARLTPAVFAPRATLAAVFTAFGVSCLWLIGMPVHALMHLPITPRLFFLPYLVCALLVAGALRLLLTRQPGG